MIDAHQHFWTPARGDYGWLTPDDPVLYRDYGPEDLAPLMGRAGVTSSVLVQAAPTVEETHFLLEIAARTDWVAGVVGWVALDRAGVEADLDALGEHPALLGIRPMIQDIADDDWMLGTSVAPGLRALTARGLTFDALVHPRHLRRVCELLDRHPDLRLVVDHAAKPDIRSGAIDAWARDIARLADETPAFCKLSGLVTEAASDWQVEDLRPVVDHVVACFGPGRLMWGSDWPVVELGGGYERWWAATQSLLAGLEDEARRAISGGTAASFYGLESGDRTTWRGPTPPASNGGHA